MARPKTKIEDSIEPTQELQPTQEVSKVSAPKTKVSTRFFYNTITKETFGNAEFASEVEFEAYLKVPTIQLLKAVNGVPQMEVKDVNQYVEMKAQELEQREAQIQDKQAELERKIKEYEAKIAQN